MPPLSWIRVGCTCAVIVALHISAGCSGGDHHKTVKAGGVVRFKNEPVANADVMFLPEGHPSASGRTNDQGRFVLTTYGSNDGATPGKHQVSIVKREPPAGSTDPYAQPIDLLPTRYGQPATSNLTAEVTSSGPNDFTFDLVE